MSDLPIVVLAFSGGLDTSYCVLYLQEQGYLVHTVLVDTGGFTQQELQAVEARAYELGSSRHTTIHLTEDYYQHCLRYLLYGNVLKNHTYPLSVSAERVFQARAVAEYAKEVGATAVAHGSTGAGNDQVRFDLLFHTQLPGVEIITPIRDNRLSREAEIAYLHDKGIAFNAEKAKYSINQGLWGTSIGGVETLTSHQYLPEEAWLHPCTKSEPEKLSITFEKGEAVALNGQAFENPVELITALNELGHSFAIGRDVHVGDTIIGIKGRVAFEAPAALMLIKAHQLLEKHTLSKWQQHWKDQLANWYGSMLHEGHYLEPAMRQTEEYLASSQERVSGEVYLELHPYRFVLHGCSSPFDMMSSMAGQYGEMNNAWSGEEVRGFARIAGNQSRIFYNL